MLQCSSICYLSGKAFGGLVLRVPLSCLEALVPRTENISQYEAMAQSISKSYSLGLLTPQKINTFLLGSRGVFGA